MRHYQSPTWERRARIGDVVAQTLGCGNNISPFINNNNNCGPVHVIIDEPVVVVPGDPPAAQ